MMLFSEALINAMQFAKKVTVLTGAGISAESGVPTFRGEDGLWKKFRPEELANFEAFMSNPRLVWEWYVYRKKLISEVEPNLGHIALSKMESHYPHFWLITQNVDGLHSMAGNQKVIELHGNIMWSRCLTCGNRCQTVKLGKKGALPHCSCGGLMRPDVVWFGEMLPQDVLDRAFEATQNCELFFSIVTSAVVYPAASLPAIAKKSGAFVVEINVEPTNISDSVDESLRGKSGEILPQLLSTALKLKIT